MANKYESAQLLLKLYEIRREETIENAQRGRAIGADSTADEGLRSLERSGGN
jgi:hypothetical protein